jgi:protocatechuate 3,4-dioxygenase beta subunit
MGGRRPAHNSDDVLREPVEGAPAARLFLEHSQNMTLTQTKPVLKTLTPVQIEGPYWKPLSPERSNLREADTKGEPIVITGHVYNQAGDLIEGAWLDFWHCDGEANYDNKGYRLRGHQWTGPDGTFRLETVIPSEYDDFLTSPDGDMRKVYRTSHIHVKVKGPERTTLTTQLYFPEHEGNSRDNYAEEALLLEIEQTPSGKVGRFDFVLR